MFSFVVLYLDHTRVALHDQYFKLLWATLPLTHLFSGPEISDLLDQPVGGAFTL